MHLNMIQLGKAHTGYLNLFWKIGLKIFSFTATWYIYTILQNYWELPFGYKFPAITIPFISND